MRQGRRRRRFHGSGVTCIPPHRLLSMYRCCKTVRREAVYLLPFPTPSRRRYLLLFPPYSLPAILTITFWAGSRRGDERAEIWVNMHPRRDERRYQETGRIIYNNERRSSSPSQSESTAHTHTHGSTFGCIHL